MANVKEYSVEEKLSALVAYSEKEQYLDLISHISETRRSTGRDLTTSICRSGQISTT